MSIIKNKKEMRHRCRIRRTANQVLANETWASILFDAEDYDTDEMHSLVSNTERITIKHAGIYLFVGQMRFSASAVGIRHARFVKNGDASLNTAYGGQNACSAYGTPFVISEVYR